jgi:hypothetical protein
LNAKNVEERTLVFIRDIQDIEEFLKEDIKLVERFIDLDSALNIDSEAKERLNQLKINRLPNAYKNSIDVNLVSNTVKLVYQNI